VQVTGRGESSLLFERLADPVSVKRSIEAAYSANVERVAAPAKMQ